MDQEAETREIKRLKASLSQTRTGAEALVLCVAQALCERDPSLLGDLGVILDRMHALLEQQGNHEAAAMIGVFGRALVDPAFQLSSEPPKEQEANPRRPVWGNC